MLRRAALLLATGATLTLAAVACGDGADKPPATQVPATVGGFETPLVVATVQKSTRGTAGGPEPILPRPAAQFQPLHEDLVQGKFTVNSPNVFLVDRARFALLGQFSSGKVAAATIDTWKFVEGWSTQYDPEGQLAGVLKGGYYLNMETYLFETVDGAKGAYQSFLAQYESYPGTKKEDAAALGNESAGYSAINGKVSRSELDNAYHRFIFRRGNMVAIVQTNGAAPYMSIDIARNYAVFIDEQALGQRPAVLPTPIPTPGPTIR